MTRLQRRHARLRLRRVGPRAPQALLERVRVRAHLLDARGVRRVAFLRVRARARLQLPERTLQSVPRLLLRGELIAQRIRERVGLGAQLGDVVRELHLAARGGQGGVPRALPRAGFRSGRLLHRAKLKLGDVASLARIRRESLLALHLLPPLPLVHVDGRLERLHLRGERRLARLALGDGGGYSGGFRSRIRPRRRLKRSKLPLRLRPRVRFRLQPSRPVALLVPDFSAQGVDLPLQLLLLFAPPRSLRAGTVPSHPQFVFEFPPSVCVLLRALLQRPELLGRGGRLGPPLQDRRGGRPGRSALVGQSGEVRGAQPARRRRHRAVPELFIRAAFTRR
mmetsp:Transcript_14267/g.58068  ORF Transcript_14267/g.58068 Transcript_14267/m.58068 type:complete len:337 (-) Transcript_14267:14-1024(-)